MAKLTHYAVLNVDPKADEATIKRAYRIAAHATHPDKHPGGHALFCLVNEAAEVLLDPKRRAAYDEELRVAEQRRPPPPPPPASAAETASPTAADVEAFWREHPWLKLALDLAKVYAAASREDAARPRRTPSRPGRTTKKRRRQS